MCQRFIIFMVIIRKKKKERKKTNLYVNYGNTQLMPPLTQKTLSGHS